MQEVRRTSYEVRRTCLPEQTMDPNSSIGRICLGEDNHVSLNDGMESHGDWETLELQDTASRGENGDKVVKKELIVTLKGIADFGNGVITIYLELDPFLDNSKETEKSEDDWELILDGIDFEDILNIDKVELPPFVCKMGKSTRNKRRLFENHQINYFDEGPSLNNGQLLTQKKVIHEATAIDIYKRFYILEEARPVIETMAYTDKYKKILDSIFLDKQKLDGEIKQEEEEAVKRVMGEELKEKECDNYALSSLVKPLVLT
ncbi:hypothetical protein Tco_1471781 [Tanacetum coccineum]